MHSNLRKAKLITLQATAVTRCIRNPAFHYAENTTRNTQCFTQATVGTQTDHGKIHLWEKKKKKKA